MNGALPTLRYSGVFAGYGTRAVLTGIELELGPGFYVVLGTNGAGKTTLFRVGAGILPPSRGQLHILGKDPFTDPSIKAKVGYLSHHAGLYPDLRVVDNLRFWGRVLGLKAAHLEQRLEILSGQLDLAELLNRPAHTLSQGQARRAGMARALLNNPALLFLDEPTSGLDPAAARTLRNLLKSLATDGRTLLFSTHNLHEASELATEVVVIRDGAIFARGPVDELAARFADAITMGFKLDSDPCKVLTGLGLAAKYQDGYWQVSFGRKQDPADTIRALVEAGIRVREAREMGNPLERIYLALDKEETHA